jgi:energy-converting hydrogenase A subunit R
VNFICFDLEGPLSPQDNAYELMKLTPNGDHVFEVISRYDDLLTLEGREGYEPGDTLALIVPFLISHHIPEATITELAQRAALVNGARELISKLNSRGWGVFCISTSYEQFAGHICHRVGIATENLACTSFPLDRFHSSLTEDDLAAVAQLEQHILTLEPMVNDPEIKERLDHFFWHQLVGTDLGAVMEKVKPMGGQRKVTALQRFAAAHDQPLKEIIVIGDSITDFKMLKAVAEAGGLAIAFNANEYALPYATMGLASTDISDLEPALMSWEEGGKEAIEAVVRDREQAGGKGDRGHFHWLGGRQDIAEPLRIHKRIRRVVREEAGKLG